MIVSSQNSKIHTFEGRASKILKFSHKIVSEQVYTWEFFQIFFRKFWGILGGLEILKIGKKNSGGPLVAGFFIKKLVLPLNMVYIFSDPEGEV